MPLMVVSNLALGVIPLGSGSVGSGVGVHCSVCRPLVGLVSDTTLVAQASQLWCGFGVIWVCGSGHWGGVAGGDKFLIHGVLFKFAQDRHGTWWTAQRHAALHRTAGQGDAALDRPGGAVAGICCG